MIDPIADMIIRIKNAHMAGHERVQVPHSNLKEAIAVILDQENYIESMEVLETSPQKTIDIELKYIGRTPVITEVRRISKPGRRVYESSGRIPKSLGGYGLTIVTTSKGVMTDKEARKQNVGGEVLCQIW
jgi:small subunit ribosomal protein S8